MDRGDRVKFKSGSKACANWRIGTETAGTILARYRSFRLAGQERVDVAFDRGIIVWGERATEFESVPATR